VARGELADVELDPDLDVAVEGDASASICATRRPMLVLLHLEIGDAEGEQPPGRACFS